MNTCRPIDMGFFTEAWARYDAEVVVQATPEQIFDVFEDAESWVTWAPPIQSVEWTSPRPFGVGTTRTVTMSGGMIGHEEFIAWERGRHMAFRFTETNIPMTTAFGEDYRVTDLGDGSCRVHWTMAMEPTGPNAIVLRLFGWVLRRVLQHMLNRFRDYVAARYGRAQAA
jgi:carbon monoxide dehydrogenase subunit G